MNKYTAKQQLIKQLAPLDRVNQRDYYRAGQVYRWSPYFEQYVDVNERTSLHPMQSLDSREYAENCVIAIVDR